MSGTKKVALMVLLALLVMGCQEEQQMSTSTVPSTDPELLPLPEEELPIGDIDDLKLDGGWGEAIHCKPIPELSPLVDPRMVLSLDGLTLRLYDPATGFEKVYPVGVGVIEDGESLTPVSTGYPAGLFWARLDQPEAKESEDKKLWAWNYSCRMWWKDSESGKSVPVFAGLPFIRLQGPSLAVYALHGPVDSYTIPSGGKLRRGYVSHGCVRMEAADILEIYALCNGKKFPVRIQKAIERREDGSAVDLQQKWLLSECETDADCNYDSGICRHNPYTGRGYCTASCEKYCYYDKYGYPVSFCVADPEDETEGICTLKASGFNNHCRRYPSMYMNAGEPRHNHPAVAADVCLPGSEGWIGDPCYTNADCVASSGTCDLGAVEEGQAGFCTQPCTKYCPDLDGHAGTFCVTGDDGAGQCVAKCAIADDCGTQGVCTSEVPRHNQPWVTKDVCLP